jgi:hypothetical protein
MTNTIHQASLIQMHWNDDLDRERRLDLYLRFEGRLSRLFRRLGLTGWCNDCFCIFEPDSATQGPDGYECPECGHTDIEGRYGPLNHTDRRE